MLKGIDISKYQTATPALTGLSFVVLRATIATTSDALYATHYANARKAGVVVMAYHYGYPAATVSIAAQVSKFLSVAKDADFLWLDQEEAGFDDAQATDFIAQVRKAGRPCGLYHSSSGFSGVPCDAKWVADWRAAATTAGHPLNAAGTGEFAGWDIWQYAGSPIDSDYLNPASPLAGLLRKGYVTQAALDAANTLAAQLNSDLGQAADKVTLLTADLAAARATNAALDAENTALAEKVVAAAATERARIATAEATRINAI